MAVQKKVSLAVEQLEERSTPVALGQGHAAVWFEAGNLLNDQRGGTVLNSPPAAAAKGLNLARLGPPTHQ